MAKTSQRHFLVQVSGVPGFWARKTGGNTAGNTRKVYDGGARTPDVLADPPEHDDMTVTRPFDPVRDQPILKSLRPLVSSSFRTITQQPTDTAFVPTGPAETFTGLLTGVTAPDVDAGSGDAGTIELKFAIQKVS